MKNNKFEYPFLELKALLEEKFLHKLLTSVITESINRVIDLFKQKIIDNLGIRNEDQFLIVVDTNINEGFIGVKMDNLFTACILYGRYVPHILLFDKDSYEYPDGCRIEYNPKFKEFMLSYPLPNSMKKAVEDVPKYAVELILGQNYTGRADGDFSIKTINGKLWFIPELGCVELDVTSEISTTEVPQHEHDCTVCKFLGRFGAHDLYYCQKSGETTVIARFSSNGTDYASGIAAAKTGSFAPLTEALKLAIKQGYLKE